MNHLSSRSNKTVDEMCAEAIERSKERNLKLDAWIPTVTRAITCRVHTDVVLHLDEAATRDAAWAMTAAEAVYAPCSACKADEMEAKLRAKLMMAGVPEILAHATLENWEARDNAEAEVLAKVREFLEVYRGYCVITGPPGCGKGHLSCGMARVQIQKRRQVHMIKQSALLRALRATYRDENAKDPVQQCIGVLPVSVCTAEIFWKQGPTALKLAPEKQRVEARRWPASTGVGGNQCCSEIPG